MTPSRRLVLLTYLIVLHAVLVVLVFKTDFLLLTGKTLGFIPPEEFNSQLQAIILQQAEQDLSLPAGEVVLVGDSHIERLDGKLGAGAVNFGIGGDTTRTLRARLPTLRSVQLSRAVVVEVGVNDLKYRPVEQIVPDYDALFGRLPASVPVLVLSVPPVDPNGAAARHRAYLRNDRIAALNAGIGQVCAAHPQCRFLDAGPALLARPCWSADGWHLSEVGDRVLVGLVQDALPAPR